MSAGRRVPMRSAHTTTHARTGGRAGGRAARARRARMGRRGAAVFGCSLRAHHSPDSASSSTREPAPRQRPPERMRDRDFDREPDEPGVCGLDGSGRAGERSGVRQLMGGRCFVVARLCALCVLVSLGQMQSEREGVNARSRRAPNPHKRLVRSTCLRGRVNRYYPSLSYVVWNWPLSPCGVWWVCAAVHLVLRAADVHWCFALAPFWLKFINCTALYYMPLTTSATTHRARTVV